MPGSGQGSSGNALPGMPLVPGIRNRTAVLQRPDQETGTQPDGVATRTVRTERGSSGATRTTPSDTFAALSAALLRAANHAPPRRTRREGGAMRSLAAQLVALALAVPVSTVSSSHRAVTRTPVQEPTVATRPSRATCSAYCQARTLRHQLRRVHGRTVALARRAALPVPPPPRLGWRRPRCASSSCTRRTCSAATASRRAARCGCGSSASEAWVCIHRHEAAWNDGGDPYWGGLQMDRGFMRAYGGDMIARHHGGLADTWTPAEQIVVAERAYAVARLRALAEHVAQLRGSLEQLNRRCPPARRSVRRRDAHEQLAGHAVALAVLLGRARRPCSAPPIRIAQAQQLPGRLEIVATPSTRTYA